MVFVVYVVGGYRKCSSGELVDEVWVIKLFDLLV